MSAPAAARPSKPPRGHHEIREAQDDDLVFSIWTRPRPPRPSRRAPTTDRPLPRGPRAPAPEPEHLKLIEDVLPDPDTSLEIESRA